LSLHLSPRRAASRWDEPEQTETTDRPIPRSSRIRTVREHPTGRAPSKCRDVRVDDVMSWLA
jgi:hypothetical protein